ncbi:MAG: peptidylprolyl isomerase [Muribaculaceae bacterium]|nr:peptidylprolyl isomerase [Muribaculaceae bacterium]
MIGDQPIWKSEVEEAYIEALQERMRFPGDPYCYIPENIAIQRLFLHQADLDTVEVPPSRVASEVDSRINEWLISAGSRQKLEEAFHKPLPEIRQWLTKQITNSYRVGMVQDNLTSDIKATPAAVRRFYNTLPADSIPMVPMKVEVQILTQKPNIPRQQIDDIKDRLRDYADRVNSGRSEFSTLAVLYSEDGSSTRGGEVGFQMRTELDPAYAAVAFNLNDPKRASAVVESAFGYHIIQLIEKRGDRINTRHILLRPKPTTASINAALSRLDSIRTDITQDLFTFEEAVPLLSADKDTKKNHGRMVNPNDFSTYFEMRQLPQEVAKAVDGLQPGEISKPFMMEDPKTHADVVAIVRLTSRLEPHRANLSDDFEQIKTMYEASERKRIIDDWISNKIANTYIRIEDGWDNCDFNHDWLKRGSAKKK